MTVEYINQIKVVFWEPVFLCYVYLIIEMYLNK